MTHLLSEVAARLAARSDTPALDASVLLAHITGRSRSWILAHAEVVLSGEQQNQLDASLKRLEQGEPFPYVLGHWEFFGLDFDVTPDVLIPRPETELLVEKAIAWLQQSPARKNVADIGTGSGAIAISIAVHVSQVHIVATDISRAALQVAKGNAQKHRVTDKIEFTQCDLLPNLEVPIAFDLICANLPYIPTQTLYTLPVYGREPTLALDGGPDGLDPIRRLLTFIPAWIARPGLILLEIEATRGAQAQSLAREMLSQAEIHLHRDLTGKDRLLEIIV